MKNFLSARIFGFSYSVLIAVIIQLVTGSLFFSIVSGFLCFLIFSIVAVGSLSEQENNYSYYIE